MGIFRADPTRDTDEAAVFLRGALSEGDRPMNDIFHEARIFQIGFGAISDAAEDIGATEFWNEKEARMYWHWECV